MCKRGLSPFAHVPFFRSTPSLFFWLATRELTVWPACVEEAEAADRLDSRALELHGPLAVLEPS